MKNFLTPTIFSGDLGRLKALRDGNHNFDQYYHIDMVDGDKLVFQDICHEARQSFQRLSLVKDGLADVDEVTDHFGTVVNFTVFLNSHGRDAIAALEKGLLYNIKKKCADLEETVIYYSLLLDRKMIDNAYMRVIANLPDLSEGIRELKRRATLLKLSAKQTDDGLVVDD